MGIANLSKNTVLANNVHIADRFFTRVKGLIGRDSLDSSEALIIKPCNSIHTVFMRFPIDVIFLDSDNRIVGLRQDIKPFRLSPLFSKAVLVIELESGVIKKTQTQLGDILDLESS